MFRTLCVLFLCFFPMTSFAEFIGPGSTAAISTTTIAKEMSDSDPVVLTGYIVKQIKSEHYIFQDEAGEIEIEIDDKDFEGITVTPSTKVKITGEVDSEWSETTIEVDLIELLVKN